MSRRLTFNRQMSPDSIWRRDLAGVHGVR